MDWQPKRGNYVSLVLLIEKIEEGLFSVPCSDSRRKTHDHIPHNILGSLSGKTILHLANPVEVVEDLPLE